MRTNNLSGRRAGRIVRASGAAALVVTMLAACGGGSDSGTEDGPYKIGFVGSLSGAVAPVGTALLAGFNLAIDDVNANGGVNGREIEVVTEDDEADASAGITAVRALAAEDVLMVAGANISTVAEGILPTLEREEIVLLAQGAPPSILDPVRRTMFQIDQTSSSNAQPMTEFAAELLGKEKFSAGIGPVDTPAGVAWGDNVETLASDKGFTITSRVSVPVTPGDVTAQAQRLVEGSPDILLLEAPDGPLVALVEKIRDLGYTKPIVNFSFGSASKTLETIADPGLYVFRTAAQYDPLSEDEGTKKFVELVDAAGQADQARSATQYTQGYLMGLTVVKALEECGEDCDRAKLADVFNDLEVETGGFTPSPLTFTEDDHLATNSGSFYSWDGSAIVVALDGQQFAGSVYTLEAEVPSS
ncbi:ABC transporter substrate-binding protein [Aeromicrobium sp.]|uniref:ABC transporter substrate-binding protein n=1 Tax=Aeromicrobium sp. TaxID=1871063 RepID=UPI0025C128B2|nr:ABC transporter substrate-binding protein [Aeromicrobium sp.]MCK5892588.1 ABC transporter substrate-binding protein [Aeromicrobium sp.]